MDYRVHPDKIVRYLLVDPGKSKFFLGIGYTAARWRELERALLRHSHTAPLTDTDVTSAYGTKYIFQCSMPISPNGRAYCIRSVWQEREGSRWVVTAFPQTN